MYINVYIYIVYEYVYLYCICLYILWILCISILFPVNRWKRVTRSNRRVKNILGTLFHSFALRYNKSRYLLLSKGWRRWFGYISLQTRSTIVDTWERCRTRQKALSVSYFHFWLKNQLRLYNAKKLWFAWRLWYNRLQTCKIWTPVLTVICKYQRFTTIKSTNNYIMRRIERVMIRKYWKRMKSNINTRIALETIQLSRRLVLYRLRLIISRMNCRVSFQHWRRCTLTEHLNQIITESTWNNIRNSNMHVLNHCELCSKSMNECIQQWYDRYVATSTTTGTLDPSLWTMESLENSVQQLIGQVTHMLSAVLEDLWRNKYTCHVHTANRTVASSQMYDAKDLYTSFPSKYGLDGLKLKDEELHVEDLQTDATPSYGASANVSINQSKDMPFLSHINQPFSPYTNQSPRYISGMDNVATETETVLPTSCTTSSSLHGSLFKNLNRHSNHIYPSTTSAPSHSVHTHTRNTVTPAVDSDVERCMSSMGWHAVVLYPQLGGGSDTQDNIIILRVYCPLLYVDENGRMHHLGVIAFGNPGNNSFNANNTSDQNYHNISYFKQSDKSKFLPSECVIVSKIPIPYSDHPFTHTSNRSSSSRIRGSSNKSEGLISSQRQQIMEQLIELWEFIEVSTGSNRNRMDRKKDGVVSSFHTAIEGHSMNSNTSGKFLATVSLLTQWLWKFHSASSNDVLSCLNPLIPMIGACIMENKQIRLDLSTSISQSTLQLDETKQQCHELKAELESHVHQQGHLIQLNNQLQLQLTEWTEVFKQLRVLL